MGHIAFHSDVMSACVYVCMSQSLGGHNLGIFYARELKFGMLFTQT